MKIVITAGYWMDVERDDDGDILMSTSDDSGNELSIYFKDKFPDKKWFRTMIKDGLKVLDEKDRKIIFKELEKEKAKVRKR